MCSTCNAKLLRKLSYNYFVREKYYKINIGSFLYNKEGMLSKMNYAFLITLLANPGEYMTDGLYGQ